MSLLSFYEETLKLQSHNTFQTFLSNRNVDSCYEFLGLSTPQLLKKFEKDQECLESGVIYESGYSLLKNRIIFPIVDSYGELLAICGRGIDNEEPKYFNTIYDKKFHLFGLHQCKKKILTHNYVIIVEGYMDWLRLHMHNLPVVALLSTSLSSHQYSLLLRYTDRILLCLDNDKAGIKASQKIVAEFSCDNGILLENITLHTHKDPDEFVQNEGILEFYELFPILLG